MDDAGNNGRRPQRPSGGGRGLDSFARLYERPLPFSLEAEMALLGSMLLDPRVVPDVVGVITAADDLYSEAHRAIYAALVEVYDKVPDADMVAIVDALRDRGQLEQVGGADYISKLCNETPSAAGAGRYAKTVADKAKLRRLIDAADRMIYDALNVGQYGVEGAREVIDAAESAVFEIAQEDQRADPQALADLLETELERLRAAEGRGISGLPTGFIDLDGLLSGLQASEMIVIAGRPSMGKTALMLNIAEQMARGGRTQTDPPRGPAVGVGIFSLEMSKSSLVMRLLSAFAQVDSHRMRTGHISAQEMGLLQVHAEGLAQAPIYIDDSPGLTLLALRARARRMVAQHNIKAIVLDYLQLLSSPGSARESRQVEVSSISRGLKALARELKVPVVCLSQLNRASEQREGNRPRMSDLRESGSIEQDADVVILLHREDYYHLHNSEWAEQNPDKVNTAELMVAKQRNGPTGTVHLTWDPKTTRFKNHSGYAGGIDGPSAGYSGASPFDAEPKPLPPPAPHLGGFSAGPRTGPVEGFRDGGGPERDEAGEGADLPPF